LKQVTAQVLSNERVLEYTGAAYYLMCARAPEIASGSRPGQFIMLKCGDDALLRRPISLHSVSADGTVELLYALRDGKGLQWLSGVEKGSMLDLLGPLGNGFSLAPRAGNLLLVAGGIGIAPLKFLAEKALAAGSKVTLLMGAHTEAGIYPERLLPAAAVKVVCTDDGSLGKKCTVNDLIPDHLAWADRIYACGPQAMFQSISAQMNTWPVQKPVEVSLEVRMGCGTGVCYSCTIKTRRGLSRVCKEGPIFNIKDIIWQEVRL